MLKRVKLEGSYSSLKTAKRPPVLRGPGGGRKASEVAEPPENLDPQDGLVWVEGRVLVPGYNDEKRKAVALIERGAKVLGLVVHDVPAASVKSQVRRRWANSAVDLDTAVAEIKDHPGMTFLAWTESLYMAGIEMNAVNFAAAKARAANALSRLIRVGRIVKLKNAKGELCLWYPTDAPR